MNKEQIDEIALRVAKARYVTAHGGTGDGINFSNYQRFTHTLIAELAKVSEPVADYLGKNQFGTRVIQWRDVDLKDHTQLYAAPLPQPDLVAEIEHLKAVQECHGIDMRERDRAIKSYVSQIAELRQQLSAAQADNEHLAKALERCKFDSLNMTFNDMEFIREAIAAHKARQQGKEQL